MIKNLHIHTVGDTPVNMFVGRWYNHYFGYPTGLATTITIDNFTADKDVPVRVFSETFIKELDRSLNEEFDDPNGSGEKIKNLNPTKPPKKIIIKNSAGTRFELPDKKINPFFKNTDFIIEP